MIYTEHKPVMIEEVLGLLDVKKGGLYIDATVGAGGHTREIVTRGGRVLGIDCSLKSLGVARGNLRDLNDKVRLVQGNFADIAKIASHTGFESVDGILFDLGVASFQIEDPSMGLSFLKDGPLDMRLDKSLGVLASDLVNSLPKAQLKEMFWESGEKDGREIAQRIVAARQESKIETTRALKEIVENVKGRTLRRAQGKRSRIHPATKVFMALRIAVNCEFENLRKGLLQSVDLLRRGGRLVVISFHSGEDRLVKDFLRAQQSLDQVKILTKKPVLPNEQEILANSRSRSAKMRAGERMERI